MAVKCRIITCPEWGARQPNGTLQIIRKSEEIIFHHTAGHVRQIDNPKVQSLKECIRYAREIQAYHMSLGWTDSGHNFLICRSGRILQGRWKTVSAIQRNRMVHSAHCPEFNEQIGIEHEHFGNERMPSVQFEASARLQAWIADQYGRKTILPVSPHSAHFPTACPANLKDDIPLIARRAQSILSAGI